MGIRGMKQIILDGHTFRSKIAAAKHYGVYYGSLRRRISEGWTLEEAFGIKPHEMHGIEVVIGDKKFSSIDAAARHYGIKNITVHKRIQSGWSLEEAFGVVSHHDKNLDGKPVTVQGTTFPTIKAASEFYGLDPFLIRSRLDRLQWSVEEAFEIVTRNTHNVSGKVYLITNSVNGFVYVGATCATLKYRMNSHVGAAIKYLTNNKLAQAIRELGPEKFNIRLLDTSDTITKLSELEAMYIERYDSIENGYNTSVAAYNKPNVQSKTYDGKKYSLRELSLKFGLSEDTVRYRLDHGLKLERKESGKSKPVSYDGNVYKSVSELARQFGMHHNTVDYKLKHGQVLVKTNGVGKCIAA